MKERARSFLMGFLLACGIMATVFALAKPASRESQTKNHWVQIDVAELAKRDGLNASIHKELEAKAPNANAIVWEPTGDSLWVHTP